MTTMSPEMLRWERYSRTGHAYDAKGGLRRARDDAFSPDSEHSDLLEYLRDCGLDGEELTAVSDYLHGKEDALSEPVEDKTRAKDVRRAKDSPPSFQGKPAVGRGPADRAMDSAIGEFQRLRQAERDVRGVVGELPMTYDSAEAVYKVALNALGVSVKGVHPSAYAAIFETAKRQRHTGGSAPMLATDSARRSSGVLDRWPLLNKVKHA